MRWAAVALGTFVASLIAFLIGWRKAGKASARADYHQQKFQEATAIIEKLNAPIMSSDDFRNAARSALWKRMRDNVNHMSNRSVS